MPTVQVYLINRHQSPFQWKGQWYLTIGHKSFQRALKKDAYVTIRTKRWVYGGVIIENEKHHFYGQYATNLEGVGVYKRKNIMFPLPNFNPSETIPEHLVVKERQLTLFPSMRRRSDSRVKGESSITSTSGRGHKRGHSDAVDSALGVQSPVQLL